MSADDGSVTPEPSVGPTSSACLGELLTRGVAAIRRVAALTLDPGEELRIEAKAHRNDLVTQVDCGTEGHITDHLEATSVPIHGEEAHRVEDLETCRGWAWVPDPIDGTLNYAVVHRDWVTPLALVDDGVPTLATLADPVASRPYTVIRGRNIWVQLLLAGSAGADDTAPRALERLEDLPLNEDILVIHYQLAQDVDVGRTIEASRDVCCYGAAAPEMAGVAAGGAVICAWPRLQPWDVVAGALPCTKTGAVLTRMDGAPFDVRRVDSLLVDIPTIRVEVLGHLRVVGV